MIHTLTHRFAVWLDRHIWRILAALTIVYALIFSAAALYKFHSFWMGFDLAVHEQVLWNTIHGRIAAISPKAATTSYLGVDIIIVELFLAPLYALLPRTETMLVLQVVLASSGAVPLFLLARDRSGFQAYGLLAALLYFAAIPIQYAMLYEFRVRTVGTVLFLWALLFFERRLFWRFMLFGLLAIWTRSEAGLTLAAFGVYALTQRREWHWSSVPVVVGAGWVVLCTQVLIPAFREDHGFLYSFAFAWLGSTPLEILNTLVMHPGYVLGQMFTPEKGRYLLHLFAPLLFLPLLRPNVLLLALPALSINLISQEHVHWSIRYHYQAFVVPFLLVAAVYALIDLREGREIAPLKPTTRRPMLRRSFFTRHRAPPRLLLPAFTRHIPSLLLVLLIVTTLGSQVVLRSPLIHLVTRPRDGERIAFARTLIEQVPDDAAVTASSALASHLGRRQEIYFFPGDIIYPPAFAERSDYLLADRQDVPPDQWERLNDWQQRSDWRTLVDERDFVLLKREKP